MLFLLFFFLRDGDAMMARARRLIPLDEARKERLFAPAQQRDPRDRVRHERDGLVQGLLMGVGFAIAGLPSPVVFGVLAALLSLLPIGGSAFVWGPARALAVPRRPLGLWHIHAGLGPDARRSR